VATKSLGHLGVAAGVIGSSTTAVDMTTINGGATACDFEDFDCVISSTLNLDPVEYSIEEEAYPAVTFTSQGIRHGATVGAVAANWNWYSESGDRTFENTYEANNWAIFLCVDTGVDNLYCDYSDGGYNDGYSASIEVTGLAG
jgi:hypothetical protein